jgi:hypothetical protein
VVGAFLALAVACGGGTLPDRVSDTGYEGTWERGNERIKTQLAFIKVDDGYRVRFDKRSADGRVRVQCDWEGSCVEFVDGEQTSTYRFRVWIDEETTLLRLECRGRVEKPTATDIYYLDQLQVRKQGLLLRAFTLEDNNGTYPYKEGPRFDLHKVSDHVPDPPDGWSPRRG